MSSKYVVGIDSSTQSTKAIAWDKNGNAIAEGRCEISLQNPSIFNFEQNPDDWWRAFCTSTKQLTEQIKPEDIETIAISNQRETIGYFDKDGNSLYPAQVWMDERARKEVYELCDLIGGREVMNNITGRPADTCPCVYRVLWMKKNEPEIFKKIDFFSDVHSYLVKKLHGEFNGGWISVDPHGMFDLQKKEYSKEILTLLELDENKLPKAFAPGEVVGKVSRQASLETGLLEGTPIIAAGGDGQLAGLGTNCTTSDRAYINLGTAVVSGVWSKDYHVSNAWRTEIAAQGDGYIFENCLKSGALLINWFADQFVPGNRKEKDFFQKLESQASLIPIGSDGLMTQPYWSACMDPHWDVSARGTITGFSPAHSPAHVYRSIVEGITINQTIATFDMEKQSGLNIKEYLAIGGGAHSPLWRQILADASGKKVLISNTVEASSLGSAMIAAYGAGWYSSITSAAGSMAGKTTAINPDESKREIYDELISIYKDIYNSTADINHRLVEFAYKHSMKNHKK